MYKYTRFTFILSFDEYYIVFNEQIANKICNSNYFKFLCTKIKYRIYKGDLNF